MDHLSLFFIAVGLAMDAFAVSVSNGVCVKKMRPSIPLKFGSYFGAFQFIMPVLGYLLGVSFADYIRAFDHWIAFGLLSLIGGKMLFESFKKDSEEAAACKTEKLDFKIMVGLAIATSIDAMAVGVSFALMDMNILLAASVIGLVAFVISCAGVIIGKIMGDVFKTIAERLGAIILIGIGIKILAEHLFFS